ncbi:MAG: alpha-2-macroglobulin [Planctomycetes bacterium]|nr:alpha-2-macroglobulin [Planctomycetota bacterium]
MRPPKLLATAIAVGLVLLPATLFAGSVSGLLVAPKQVFAGGSSSVTITTLDPGTRSGVPANVTIDLVDASGNPIASIWRGTTGAAGHVTALFSVPPVAAGTGSIVAQIAGADAPLEAEVTIAAAPAILIETDKPIYKPGQTLEGRVLLLNNDLVPLEGDVEIVIRDGKGIKLDRQTLRTNEYGGAPFSLPIANEANFGVWKIEATSGDGRSEIDLRVEPYVLPRFRVETDMPRSWFLPDETIEGTIRAQYFFGKPVAGTARILAKRYVAEWEDFDAFEAPLDGAGEVAFDIDAVGFVAGTAGASGDGSVLLEIAVEDESGHEEETTLLLRIPPAPVKVELIPASETVKADIPLDVLVVTETPDDVPVDRQVQVRAVYETDTGTKEETKTVATQGGMAETFFTPPAGVYRATISTELKEGAYTATASVELAAAYSPSASFIQLSRIGTGAAQVGTEEVLRVRATYKGTTYYDVVAGGRTVYAQASDGDEIRIPVTARMAPEAKVVAYRINPNNEVSADSVSFPVEVPVSISLDTQFDAETVAPGDPVKVTIQTPERSLVGVSIVDESVYALAEGRLTMAGVFAELEKRFMEPLMEVHGDDGGGGDIWGGWAGSWMPRGASDALGEAGLQVAATSDLTVPSGDEDKWRWLMEDAVGGGPLPPSANGDWNPGEGLDDGLAQVERVRQFFPETWVWQPMLLTDEQGRAELELEAPDTITSWKLHAVASARAGGIGIAEASLTVFQEFFAEPDLPYAVTRGEEVPLRIQVFNYLPVMQVVRLELEGDEWFELVDPGATTVAVDPGSVLAATFTIRPVALGLHQVRVVARGANKADAVVREIHVEPEGVPAVYVENGRLKAGERATIDLDYPEGIVPGSETTILAITPSLMGPTIEGLDDLLGMPYGCGEQNMMFFAPDVHVLRYLGATGNLSPETRAHAEYFINTGYQRQLTYRRQDGSFSAFGDQDQSGSLWLTAFVLGTFADARDVKTIDETVLSGAAEWIASHQKADGSWSPIGFIHHQELIGGMGGDYALTGFVAGALAQYGADPTGALPKALAYLSAGRTAVADDAYALAIAALALSEIPGGEAAADAVIEDLLELAVDEGVGIHWTPHPIETTSYAALALMERERLEAQGALEWIATQRNALGGYGGTQDTVMAIRALVAAAIGESRDLDLVVRVMQGGAEIDQVVANAANFDLLQTRLLPSAGTVELVAEGRGSVGYQIAKRFHVPGSLVPPPKDMALEVRYGAEHVDVDDLVDVFVRVAYTGLAEKTGMAIIDIGIPTGFSAERSTLDGLVEAGTLKRFDIAGRKAILYVEALARETPLEFSFQVRALFPVRAAPVPSKAYDYYDPDTQATIPGDPITVGGEYPFVRGDANADGRIDLGDAVSILSHLFGGEKMPCEDALDVNDDGILMIDDAIRLLMYLFVSPDPPIPAPFDAPGVDGTEDDLGCRGK